MRAAVRVLFGIPSLKEKGVIAGYYCWRFGFLVDLWLILGLCSYAEHKELLWGANGESLDVSKKVVLFTKAKPLSV